MSIDFDDLRLGLLLRFCFDWEDISNTRDSVSSAIQTPRISLKILRCASYLQLSSRCLDIPMKHCLTCLIYHIKSEKIKSTVKAIGLSGRRLSAASRASLVGEGIYQIPLYLTIDQTLLNQFPGVFISKWLTFRGTWLSDNGGTWIQHNILIHPSNTYPKKECIILYYLTNKQA